MLLDRALTPELLDLAFGIARSAGDRPDARRLLAMSLRDQVSAQEAEGKTKKCLTRVWINPPEAARDMLRWAIDHAHLDPARRVIHFGALLATFPFVGAVAAIVGRDVGLDGSVTPAEVRRRACLLFGDRSSVDVSARKVYTTFRYLGLLAGPNQGPLTVPERLVVPHELAGWVAHALLLTRGVDALDARDLTSAPELFPLKATGNGSSGYPLLEAHAEGNSRTVLVHRQ
jgi:hypothetical protein